MKQTVEKHEQDISDIKDDFDNFRENNNNRMDVISGKLDSVFKQLAKPLFTTYQAIGLVVIMLCYAVGIVLYTEGTRSDVRVNTVEIGYVKDDKALQILQNATILKALSEIQTDVAVLKNEHEKAK